MDKRNKIFELRDKGLTIPNICEKLDLSKGTVGYHLKFYNGVYKNKWLKKDNKFIILIEEEGKNIINLYKEENNISNISKLYKVSQFFIKKFLINEGIYIEKNRKLDIKKLIEGKITYINPYYGSINGNIKNYLIKNKILEYKCSICDINNWLGKGIILDLDHINGNRNYNILSNLRLLCPNCHSQTETYKGKNNRKTIMVELENPKNV